MRSSSPLLFTASAFLRDGRSAASHIPPLLRIKDATFFRRHPTSSDSQLRASDNPPLFSQLCIEIPVNPPEAHHWAILGPSFAGKTTFLEILRGKFHCIPPNGRTYPYLATDEIAAKDPRLRLPSHAVQLIGFDGERGGLGNSGMRGAYLSARYESRREDTDFSLLDYLKGNTSLNPAEDLKVEDSREIALLEKVIKDLRLAELVDLPVSNLSNGQTRRARIAKALLGRPELLLLDEPFMGLDPPTLTTLSPLLHGLAEARAPRLLLSLRPQDPIPDWITHLMVLGPNFTIAHRGQKDDVLKAVKAQFNEAEQKNSIELLEKLPFLSIEDFGRVLKGRAEGSASLNVTEPERKVSKKTSKKVNAGEGPRKDEQREALVEMSGVQIKYGEREVLGSWEQDVGGEMKEGLHMTVRRGDRWGIFGPNGSGKTTILSLICSDHPQTYSLPVKIFGRSRLPTPGQPGISIFDIQSRIGHSSPEIHAFFPRNVSVRRVIESAWAETFLGKPQLDAAADRDVDAILRWFAPELNPNSGYYIKSLLEREAEQGSGATKRGAPYVISDAEKAAAEAQQYLSEDVDWADNVLFGELPFAAQRTALLLRAIAKKPELVILDEAFSGMDPELRDKCMLFLEHGETRTIYHLGGKGPKSSGSRVTESALAKKGMARFQGLGPEQALLCISHVREEVPSVIRQWICLPEPHGRKAPRFGDFKGAGEMTEQKWDEIWGL